MKAAAAPVVKPRIVGTLIAWAIIFEVAAGGQAAAGGESRSATATLSPANGKRHHYTMNARVRPLLFWISRDDVGDAVVVKRQNGEAVGYSLLIGSDPARTPRRINRWGYIDEEIRGNTATLVGLMTESDEESVSQAEASLKKAAGQRTFNVIRASIADGEARSVVTSIAAPNDYTLHHVDTVLDLASRAPDTGKVRVIQFPAGTRPGFLAAVADAMHGQVSQWRTSRHVAPSEPIGYVYHGKMYQLRVTRTHVLSGVRIGDNTYEDVIASQFQIKDMRNGELTDFSMTFAADGSLAETPLAVTYQPRWWLEVQLRLDDKTAGPALARGVTP